MLKKRIVITLTFLDGVLFRTKKFNPDYRYTKNFVDFYSIDEIVLVDISKNKLQESFLKLIEYFVLNCNVPLTVGGGIYEKKQASKLLSLGIEKIILNSSSYNNLDLINEVSEIHGSQSIIHSIDILKKNQEYIVKFFNNSLTCKLNLFEWLEELNKRPIGEVIINSIDNDGSLMGYDINLINLIEKKIEFPFLVLGGCGNWHHILQLFEQTEASAACTQNIFHFSHESVNSLKDFLSQNGQNIRN